MAAAGRINGGRVLLGGLLAGLTINLLQFAFHALIRRQWEAAMSSAQTTAAQKPAAMAAHFGWSWVIAIGLVWPYAAIRPSLSLARDLPPAPARGSRGCALDRSPGPRARAATRASRLDLQGALRSLT